MTDKESLLLTLIDSVKYLTELYESYDFEDSRKLKANKLLLDSISQQIQIGGEKTTLLNLMTKSLCFIGIRDGFEIEINRDNYKQAFKLKYIYNAMPTCPLYIDAHWLFVMVRNYILSPEFRNNFLL